MVSHGNGCTGKGKGGKGNQPEACTKSPPDVPLGVGWSLTLDVPLGVRCKNSRRHSSYNIFALLDESCKKWYKDCSKSVKSLSDIVPEKTHLELLVTACAAKGKKRAVQWACHLYGMEICALWIILELQGCCICVHTLRKYQCYMKQIT